MVHLSARGGTAAFVFYFIESGHMSVVQRPIIYNRRDSVGYTRRSSSPLRTATHSPSLYSQQVISSQPPALAITPQPEVHVAPITAAAVPKIPKVTPLTDPDTSIVIPVMNESENVLPLIARIAAAVHGHPTEVIFVDDSRDTLTVDAVEEAQSIHQRADFAVYILHREGDQRWGGLSGAVADGMHMAQSDQILVMDGDLQHPPETIPAMLKAGENADVVVASRYRKGGSANGLDGGIRHLVSRGSTLLAKAFFPWRLRGVTDPMTGFFIIDRSKIVRSRLRPKGFKILLELLATHPELRRAEVPLQFAERLAGESHGTIKQGLEFFGQLLDLRFGSVTRRIGRLPKPLLFAGIGGSVFVLGMALLYLLVERFHVHTHVANAIQLALTFWLNYVLNRRITWRERTITRRAAYKFLVSRGVTTVINYFLFAWLISLQFAFNVLGHSLNFALNYIVVNVITLIVVMGLNYEISDRWAFAEPKARKARRPATSLVVSLVVMLALAIGVTIVWSPATVLPILLAASSLALFLQASIEVWRMAYSYRDPASIERLRFPTPESTTHEKFCIIVPARHESATLAHTLELLAKQTHSNVDIISVICDDDQDTLAVARGVADHEPRVTVMAYPLAPNTKPSKPLQLNYVLEQTAGMGHTVFGIFDAEDTVHPELLVHIDAAFREDVDIVQGGVQLMNYDSSWYALHNVLEYYRWFNSAMAYNADKQFMPLGGNTIFIRADLLRQVGGWPVTLTEDCSLGVLLSTRYSARTAVYYDPRLATREETPDTLRGLFKQRVRWNQGFVHEWRQGIWLELPTFRQRLLAGYVLLSPLLLAVISILMAISVFAIFYLKAPVALAMLMYLPLIPVVLLTILNAIFLYDFGASFKQKIGLRHYAVLLITQGVYQIVLNTAALWSVIRELRGDDSWYKTPHSGLHRSGEMDAFESMQPAYAYTTEADHE